MVKMESLLQYKKIPNKRKAPLGLVAVVALILLKSPWEPSVAHTCVSQHHSMLLPAPPPSATLTAPATRGRERHQ